MTSMMSDDNIRLTLSLQRFFYEEAELLDSRNYRGWLNLLTDECTYHVPIARNVQNGRFDHEFTAAGVDINWFDEDKATLEKRIKQIETGIHWAEEPVSRTTHIVTNLLVTGVEQTREGRKIHVVTKILVNKNRLDYENTTLIGKRTDTLLETDGQFKIAARTVYLDQSVLLVKNLTTIL